jgi:HD-like signal output (HDOD) protein/nitrogen-specific signal transduction histidine kinase
MKANKPLINELSTFKNLPTLPHILLKLLDACNQENVDLVAVADIVEKDASLSAKLLKLVNSAYFGLPNKIAGIGQAVVYVGTSTIRNMAICACVYEAFPNSNSTGLFNMKSFWWHSLKCAFIAKAITSEINLDQPDEAFVTGLLHDIGKLVLWTNFRTAYEEILRQCSDHSQSVVEEEHAFGATHCQVGAWLLQHWCFQEGIADSVAYHHEFPERISQAFAMTQVVWIANRLSQDNDEAVREGLALAQKILGISYEDSSSLIEKASQESKEVAEALDIDVSVNGSTLLGVDENDEIQRRALTREIQNESLLLGMLEGFLAARDRNEILSVISDGFKIILDANRFLFYFFDTNKEFIFGYLPDADERFKKDRRLTVSMMQDKSLLVQAILKKVPSHSFDTDVKDSMAILDQQIMGMLGGQGIFCLPFISQGDAIGVAVLGINKKDLPELLKNKKLINIFMHKASLALRVEQLRRSQLHTIQEKRIDASTDLARKVVHEVNNPLSVIKNYLKILELKLAEQEIAHDEIRIINEEIIRVSRLLGKLTNFSKHPKPTQTVADINRLIRDLVSLTKDSLSIQSHISIQMSLERNLPKVVAEEAELKQVFINLIKNAAEAIISEGKIHIRTQYNGPPIDGLTRRGENESVGHVEVIFEDDGPGIPEDLKERLFEPYVSSKKENHSGLGLSIAYSIIRSFKGQIYCDSTFGKGTQFKIELPAMTPS